MKIYIKSVENGYIITDAEEKTQYVFSSDEKTEVESFETLLQDILFMWGPSTSKHCAQRIHVGIKPGDEFDGIQTEREVEQAKIEGIEKENG